MPLKLKASRTYASEGSRGKVYLEYKNVCSSND